ncbi:MAG: hypothetical protein FWG71_06395 [Synergistaceae bacterium]|nr:hypothetical protein [Synergistaceae bacterium]
MPWLWSAFTPHPPVIVPEVGREREREAAVTVSGIERLAGLISDRRPEYLLILSPHQQYAPAFLSLNGAPRFKGSFAPFGAPSVSFELGASAKLPSLAKYLTSAGIAVREENPDPYLDHGALVPLYFMRKAWRKLGMGLPDIVLASPIGLGPEKSLKFGEALASFDDGTSWGLLASGDLSHRLTPDAPAGYSPAGKKFDAAVVAALSSANPEGLLALAPKEREEAGECGLCSVMAMLGLCRALDRVIEVISYEGPFGVGYCNALAL